jgi:hypothetical protein
MGTGRSPRASGRPAVGAAGGRLWAAGAPLLRGSGAVAREVPVLAAWAREAHDRPGVNRSPGCREPAATPGF